MNQALYRKYRSRSFKEVVGQEHVTKTLEQALKSGRISHAYLFTGPRGVGKTSVARILAHEVNGLPYKGESMHLDIIEIDAASNRRIDEIRELRERVRIAPAIGKYKVYIIDEVHMLTREAFNALLKTLEEPPQHSIFILATTEAHKLPETIISRTQRFEFKPITAERAAKHLALIAKSEKLDIEPGALSLLAEFGKGSFRDSIGYLDQLSASGKTVKESMVREILGLPSEKEIKSVTQSVLGHDEPAILTSIQALKEQGVDAAAAASALASNLRREIINGNHTALLAPLLRQLIEVPASASPYDFLEICLLEAAAQTENSPSGSSVPFNKSDKPPGPAADPSPAVPVKIQDPSYVKKSIKNSPKDAFSLDSWNEVVESARLEAASIYTALRLASPLIDNGTLILRFRFPLHQKKANQAKNKEMILKLIENITGHKVSLTVVVDKEAFESPVTKTDHIKHGVPNSLHSINSIFGAAEVL